MIHSNIEISHEISQGYFEELLEQLEDNIWYQVDRVNDNIDGQILKAALVDLLVEQLKIKIV